MPDRDAHGLDATPFDAADPYAPPASQVLEPRRSRRRLFLARPSQRLGAFLIDGVVAPLCLVLVALVAAVVINMILFIDTTAPLRLAVVVWGALGAVGLLYLVVQGTLLRSGWTLGKRIVGLRIVCVDGRRATLGRIFWARLVLWLVVLFVLSASSFGILGLALFLVDALMIHGDRHRTLRDRLCGTIVVTT